MSVDKKAHNGYLVASFPLSWTLTGKAGENRCTPTFNTEWIRTDYGSLYWEILREDGSAVDPNFYFRVTEDKTGPDGKSVNWGGVRAELNPTDNINNGGDVIRPGAITDVKRIRKLFVNTEKVVPEPSKGLGDFSDVVFIVNIYGLIDAPPVRWKDVTGFKSSSVYKNMQVSKVVGPGRKFLVAVSAAGDGDEGRAGGDFSTNTISDDYTELSWQVVYHDGSRPEANNPRQFCIFEDKTSQKDPNIFNGWIQDGSLTPVHKMRNLYASYTAQPYWDFTLYVSGATPKT